eukprot:maker-scaffold632_size121914-snap-gene-0.23 protein:Tk02598 transcript:maker-scaffold632_size121914-snap-gene-0.23-mRNA-1 annotation:"homolog dnj-2 precursor"
MWRIVGLFMVLLAPLRAQDIDLYCGDQNCYDVLGVTRDSPKSDLGKVYRKLAGKWHPDRFKSEEDKDVAGKKFMQIAAAYELLRDDESREEYDYMLDHPEEMWQNYYRYYRRRMAPKVDVRIVIAVTISIISAIQYYSAWSNYEDAIKYLVTVPKYRIQATEIAKEDGLLKRDKKVDRGKSKEEIKDEEERVLRQVIEGKMDIHGGYAKPKLTDVLCAQIVLLPWTAVSWGHFYGRWFWKFGIQRQEYGEDEKLYVIRKFMAVSQGQFESMPVEEREEMLELELWKKENFTVWKQEKDDEMRAKLAQSGRYKQYRRYMKNHGPDRMTFDDS